MSVLPNLYDLSLDALAKLLEQWGEKPFRAKQIYRQLYVERVTDVDQMTDLPKALRHRLSTEATIGALTLDRMQTGDKGLTRKAAFMLPSGEIIESVLMIYPERATVCISSQAGCAIRCSFCATGKMGLLRNLTSGEIIEQVLWAQSTLATIAAESDDTQPTALTNIVYMGMGEPFHNYEAWWESVQRLHDPKGANIGARNFTVSTSGLIPGIRRLADCGLPINLAISLHAPDDALRTELMPINKAYPIQDLLEATRDYTIKTGRRVSFEYVLLEGTNDSPEQGEALARVLRDGPMKDRPQFMHVNLIPWNPVPGTPLARSSRKRVNAFQQKLREQNIPCTVRVERGTEIAAACGQLAGADDVGDPTTAETVISLETLRTGTR
ncbi:MAG: 23S rRNA (adenine(2503)-C(2))-methyltransferase RlmN [Kiritimatiellae bacterium]|nr:23S rRNA (adenine(2503)-C(2))-methyltransferase RlmN [Kiritimatiellia bacterium]